MEQTSASPRRMLFIGLGAVVLLIAVIAVVAYALFGTTKREDNASTSTQPSESSVATKDDVKQNLSDVSEAIKQANSDTAAAKAALKDNSKQIRVGN